MGSKDGLVIARQGPVRDGLQAVLRALPGVIAQDPVEDEGSALDRFQEDIPGLILIDSSLPENEARAILEYAKANKPQVYCLIIVKGHLNRSGMEAAGADIVLVEGVSAERLSKTIKAALAHSPEQTTVDSQEDGDETGENATTNAAASPERR